MNRLTTRLATPGPTTVPSAVLLAGAGEVLHHRSPAVHDLSARLAAGLQEVLATEHDVYTLLSSGTGAMEAAVSNCFGPGDTVVVVANGYFGDRFIELCERGRLKVVPVAAPWGEPVATDEVEAALRNHPETRGVLVVYSETSTGAVNDVQAMAEVVGRTDAILVVDAISGLISHRLPMDEWGVDVVLAASHKGFMLPPGLAFVALSDKAWSAIDRVEDASFYFSFRRYRKFHPLAPASGAVSLLPALEVALDALREEGLAAVTERHATVAVACRRALEALGFRLVVSDEANRSNTVTVAEPPGGVTAADLIAVVRDQFGLVITGGQGPFAGQVVRVGHIGMVDPFWLGGVVTALELGLATLGAPVALGAGLTAMARSVAATPAVA